MLLPALKKTSIALLGALLVACTPYVYQADFPLRSDTVRKGDVLGPFTGRVVDAGTGKPVSGALVYASWEFVRGVGFVVPGGAQTWTGTTDSDGQYSIPRLAELPGGMSRAVARIRIVIYKRGFVAYRSDRVFPGDSKRYDFRQLENVATLERWSPELSHADHLRFIGGDGPLAKAASWEVQVAVAEIEGRPTETTAAKRPAATGDLLDASDLLDEDDLEDVTGFEGSFTVSRLKDVARSPHYDSRHFRAEGKDQRFDAAFRVWKLGTADAAKHYKKLLSAYPNAKPTDELGDRSFRSYNKAISALVWLSNKQGVVVSLTCGRELCKDWKKVRKLADLIQSRLDRLDQESAPRRPLIEPGVNPFRPVQPRVPVLR